MKLAIAFVLCVSAAMASVGAYVGSHPEALTQPLGIEAFDALNAVAARFGQTRSAMIVVRATEGTVLDARALEAIDGLAHRLKTSGACQSVLGLAQLPEIVLDDEGAQIADLIARAPANAAERSELERRVREHPNAVGELVSSDLRATLLICPLSEGGSLETLGPLLAAQDEAISAGFVGPLGLANALGDDLVFSSILFVVLGLMIAIAERRPRPARALTMLVAVLVQAALVLLLQPLIWGVPSRGLQVLLGPGAAHTQQALDHVTGADHLVLVDVEGDFTQAADVARMARLCAGLQASWEVSCPTGVLATLAKALAGTDALPRTDEQLKALWFFAGARPELALVFSQDKHHALLRVRTHPGADLQVLERDLSAHASGLRFSSGGIPFIDRALAHSRVWVLSLLAALTALAALLGRLFGRDLWPLGEVLLAPALLVKVGLASRVLLVIGLLVLFASVGARTRSDA